MRAPPYSGGRYEHAPTHRREPTQYNREVKGKEKAKELIIVVTEFFMPMIPPTITHQEKQVHVVNGKPLFYEPQKLKAARAKLEAHLARHKPEQQYGGAVELVVKWCFPRGRHEDGEYRSAKPDTDNLQKLLKDCMTVVGFWKDDALVCREIAEKFWAEVPGIYIRVSKL